KAALGPALATAAGASAQGLGRGVGTALAIRRVLRRPGEVVIAVPAALLVTSFGRHCRSPCRRGARATGRSRRRSREPRAAGALRSRPGIARARRRGRLRALRWFVDLGARP